LSSSKVIELYDECYSQVTEETANVLTSFGIQCHFRGEIEVKGKGLLPTFFIQLNDKLEFIKDNEHRLASNAFETKL